MEEINQIQPEDNLAESLDLQITYEYASTGQRFLNYLIDNILMRFGLSFSYRHGRGSNSWCTCT